MKKLLPILLFLLFLNCTVPGAGATPSPVRTVEVRLENYNWLDARLYMIQGGSSRKIGDSIALSKSTRQVRSLGGVTVRFFVRFLAGYETWLSPEIHWINPGDCVVVRIEIYLNQSAIYPCSWRS